MRSETSESAAARTRQPGTVPCCRARYVALKLIVVSLLLLAGWGLYVTLNSDQAKQADPPCVAGPTARPNGQSRWPESKNEELAESSDPDRQFQQLAVGTWEDDYQGKRTMTIRDDGTATMVAELGGLKAAMFGWRLQFEMTWSVKDGRLAKRTLGGEPAAKVDLILKMMGDRVEEPILELTEERMLLLDEDGRTKYDWRRVR